MLRRLAAIAIDLAALLAATFSNRLAHALGEYADLIRANLRRPPLCR